MARGTIQRREPNDSVLLDGFVLSELGRFQADLAKHQRHSCLLDNWRARVLKFKDHLGALANAIKDAIDARGIEVRGHSWTEIFELAEETEKPDPKYRFLCSIVALWGNDFVEYYDLQSQKERQLRAIRDCAMRDPDLQWFPKFANVVMLRRHEHSLIDNRASPIQMSGDNHRFPLKLEDLTTLAKFAKGTLASCPRYGKELIPSSFEDRQQVQRVHEWATCKDGGVELSGSPLCLRFPTHFGQYLLRKDRFGLLIPNLKRLNDRPAGRAEFKNLKLTPPGENQSLGDTSAHMLQVSPKNTPHSNQLEDPEDTEHAQDSDQLEEPEHSPENTPCPSQAGDQSADLKSTSTPTPSQGGDQPTDLESTPSPSQGGDQPTNLENHSTTSPSQGGDRPTSPSQGVDGDEPISPSQSGDRPTDRESTPTTSQGSDYPKGPEDPKTSRARMPQESLENGINADSFDRPLHSASVQVEQIEAVSARAACNSAGIGLTKPAYLREAESTDTVASDFICPLNVGSDRQSEFAQWNRYIQETAREAPHPTLKHWIDPVHFASTLEAESSESYRQVTQQCDVVRLSAEIFKTLVQQNTIFSTPLVIEEHFADSGDHSLPAYIDTLTRTFPDGFLDMRCHQGAPERTPISTIIDMMRSEGEKMLPNGPNLLDLTDLSNAIKPSLTRLPRLRLLDYLTKSAKALAMDRFGKQETLTPFDIGGSQSFEIFGFRGAFSGAHLDILGGTWLRNLFGIKLWMFVPENLMTDTDWSEFARDGPDWNPREKSRAIILQPGDVFVMPPGVRVVHAVHTLEACLMNGGIFWDEKTIVQTLNAVHWDHSAVLCEDKMLLLPRRPKVYTAVQLTFDFGKHAALHGGGRGGLTRNDVDEDDDDNNHDDQKGGDGADDDEDEDNSSSGFHLV